jgi:hypothetical protein
MCYSVESSLKTTTLSFLAIVYLLSSKIPHFQWLGITLIGWCGMQFDELLLWLTDPRKGCTKMNEIITMTLIPFTLLGQPLFSLWGSLYVFPWATLSQFKKKCMLFYTVFCSVIMYFVHFYKPDKTCTTVTKKGHLNWVTRKFIRSNNILPVYLAALIILPLLFLWNKNLLLIFCLLIFPIIGFKLGQYSDAQGSIWCYYTSYSSIIASVALFLKQMNIYNIL